MKKYFQQSQILENMEPQLNNLLDLIKFNNKAWTNLISNTFMVGFVMAMMSCFLSRSFYDDVSVVTNVMIFSYMILSFMLLIICTKYPSALHKKVKR